jgi:hypothetical protein
MRVKSKNLPVAQCEFSALSNSQRHRRALFNTRAGHSGTQSGRSLWITTVGVWRLGGPLRRYARLPINKLADPSRCHRIA